MPSTYCRWNNIRGSLIDALAALEDSEPLTTSERDAAYDVFRFVLKYVEDEAGHVLSKPTLDEVLRDVWDSLPVTK